MSKELEQRIELLEERVTALERLVAGNDNSNRRTVGNRVLSVNEFLGGLDADNDVKKTLFIAYWLDKFGNKSPVNTDDLKQIFRLARLPLPANINDKVNINIKNRHLAEDSAKKGGKKAWYVTDTGFKFVEAELNKQKK